MTREKWITDWENIGYPFSLQSWTRSYTTQVHIGRQDDSGKTLCGIDARGWDGADPEPMKPDPNKFYGSCTRCRKIFHSLRDAFVGGKLRHEP